ncbi:MAG: DUF2200 domain-containing protein [Coriobacteriales bacterium]|jgi:hypothetical protein|nr:DUF2200 domain-containing protein [Coriobacteriales bacterium]
MEQSKVFAMKLAKVYPAWVAKAERKGRTQAEVDEVICWLTGYSPEDLAGLVQSEASLQDFFNGAVAMNPNRKLIKGSVCGIRVEDMQPGLMQEIRYLDKLVDELAKGKALEKILRQP